MSFSDVLGSGPYLSVAHQYVTEGKAPFISLQLLIGRDESLRNRDTACSHLV